MSEISNIPGGWKIGNWCKFTVPNVKGLLKSRKNGKIIDYDPDTNILKIECNGLIFEQIHTQEFGGISGIRPDDIECKGVSDSRLPGSIDARVWAEEFCKVREIHPFIPCDEEYMVTWFANAIMAGWDESGSRKSKEEKWVYCLQTINGELIALYSEIPTKETCDRDYSLHLGKDLKWSVPNIIYVDEQDSAWNCILTYRKIDSLNRQYEQIGIKH